MRRRYDLEVLMHRTIVAGLLALFIAAVYTGIVGGVGLLVGQPVGDPSAAVSILATAAVAVAFQPARARVQRVANRLVYGARATPYEVMSDFSRRMSAALSMEDVLPRMAEAVAEGLAASRVEVVVRLPGGGERSAVWPAGTRTEAAPSWDRELGVRHRGEEVGRIAIATPAGESLSASHVELLERLAGQAGLAFHNLALTSELQAKLVAISEQAAEIRLSRQRIVALLDAERRRIERDIHDGAQQHLVAMSVKLGLVAHLLERDPARAAELLDGLSGAAHDALEELRDLARGTYPKLLTDQGLLAALRSQASRASVPVRVEATDLPRYPADVEAAAYFCCLEAMQNAAKHAAASEVVVRIEDLDGVLAFTVADDGRGFELDGAPRGTGLQSLADRLASLAGELEVRSAPGEGTTVSGRIPPRVAERVG